MKPTKFLCTAFVAGLLATTGAIAQTQTGGAAGAGGGPGATQPQTPAQSMPAAETQDSMANASAANSKVDDKKFVKDAALGGLTEVELGKLAAQKASDPKVKEFGQKMVDDHTKANDNLKQVASKSNIPIPSSLDGKHQSRIDKLSKLSGEQFDKAYVKDQLKDHETDVREFKNEASNGSNPDVKAFASSTVPVLQEHLEMVKSLNKGEKEMSKR